MHEHTELPPRAILVAVQLPDADDAELAESMAELRRLAETLGLRPERTVTQRRESPDPGTYVGSGKLEELKLICKALGGGPTEEDAAEGAPVDPTPRTPVILLVDHEITPSQARNLEKATGAEVLDRTAVILEIFHRHARSRAAKAQVEMVRLRYMAPRLREKGAGRDRQRGGIGGKGAGESELELDRRKIRDRMAELAEEIAAIDEERRTQRARRRDLQRVALVGYTNAGKSTLMRTLTGSEVYVADKLFATLDTTVRVLVPETRPRILVSDTVGFIRKLPHDLVASFKSTLEEAAEAGLLLHVVDASDPNHERQLEVTHEVLAEIGAGEIPRMIVCNKIDRVDDEATATAALLHRYPEAIVMSARRPADVARLHAAIVAFFAREYVEDELRVGYDRMKLVSEIHESALVLDEKYDEEGVVLRARAHPQVLERLRQALGVSPT